MTAAIRYKASATNYNLNALLSTISNECVERLILFATPRHVTNDIGNMDGSELNLPLVAAVAEFTIPHVDIVRIVFDGLILTARSYVRYLEVKALLDAAENSGKVFFSKVECPFTSGLSPEDAADKMLASADLEKLGSDSRKIYFSLLSNLSEKSFADLKTGY